MTNVTFFTFQVRQLWKSSHGEINKRSSSSKKCYNVLIYTWVQKCPHPYSSDFTSTLLQPSVYQSPFLRQLDHCENGICQLLRSMTLLKYRTLACFFLISIEQNDLAMKDISVKLDVRGCRVITLRCIHI